MVHLKSATPSSPSPPPALHPGLTPWIPSSTHPSRHPGDTALWLCGQICQKCRPADNVSTWLIISILVCGNIVMRFQGTPFIWGFTKCILEDEGSIRAARISKIKVLICQSQFLVKICGSYLLGWPSVAPPFVSPNLIWETSDQSAELILDFQGINLVRFIGFVVNWKTLLGNSRD